jgi:DNA-directed RNA polymerase subunit RPC12/RpoP
MFCDKCGAKNPDQSQFCSICGKPLKKQVSTSATVQKSSTIQCPSCGTVITDSRSPYCPKCLVIVNRDILKKTNIKNEVKIQKTNLNAPEILMKFDGKNGQIDLYKDKLIIRREGFWAAVGHGFTKGDKTIYLNQITGIQLKLGGLLVGYIQFTLPGGVENKKGALSATEDENSVTFMPASNDLAIQLKEKIEELKNNSSRSSTIIAQSSSADEIRKFKQLFDEGIITKEEFDKKKKELLGI